MSSPFAYTTIYFDTPPRAGRVLDIWIPEKKEIRPLTLVFTHGGGWRQGHRENMHALMTAFYEEGFVCISLDYRVSGEMTASMQLAEVREGLALAKCELEKRGVSQSFVLYGSSAGGHLTLLAGLAPVGVCGDLFEGDTPDIVGIIASCAPITFEPWEDIFPGSWVSMQKAVGESYEENPELYRRVSPEKYIVPDSPPIFFLLGECEHMFPNHLTIDLVERIKAQGGRADYRVYPAAEHGFFYALQRRSQQMAFQDVLAFLEKLCV